jgi:hypothetical protein
VLPLGRDCTGVRVKVGTIIPTWCLVQRLVDGGDYFLLLDLSDPFPFSSLHGSSVLRYDIFTFRLGVSIVDSLVVFDFLTLPHLISFPSEA